MAKYMRHPDAPEGTPPRKVSGHNLERDLKAMGFEDAPPPPPKPRQQGKKDRPYWSDYAFRDY